jgi:peroxiredoxin
MIAGFSQNKSGGLFIFTTFFCMMGIGFLTDYPYHTGFPAASILLPFLVLGLHVRSWFHEKMGIHKWPKFELIWLDTFSLSFFVVAFFSGYNWHQWITGGFPAMSYLFFSIVIYQDRNQARLMVMDIKNKTGSKAPDFTLADQHGNMTSLSDILKTQHALLIFVRGDWCPTCHMMMRGYIKNKEKFAGKNVKIIGIGPDPIGVNKEMMDRLSDDSIMLSDDGQETAAKYSGTIQENNPVTKSMYKNGIPLPASFLVHQNGNIIYTSRSDKAAEILQPDKIFEALSSI